MRRHHLLTYALPLAAIAGVAAYGVLSGGDARAANPTIYPTNATVNILAALVITETEVLNFGKIVKPTTGSNTFTIGTGANGPATPTGGGDGSVVGGTGGDGDFSVAGTSGETATFGADSSGSNCDGTTVAGVTLTIGTPSPTSGVLTPALFELGGALLVTSAAPSGVTPCSYNVSASY